MRRYTFSLLFLAVLFCLLPQMAEASPPPDSIPRIDYIGYRLYLTHFEVVKEKKGRLYIKLSAINTGNKAMSLGKGAAQIFPVAKFDPSLGTAALMDFQTEIYYKLLEEKMTIPIGAISTNIELRLQMDASDTILDAAAGDLTQKDPETSGNKKAEELKEPIFTKQEPVLTKVSDNKETQEDTSFVEISTEPEVIPEEGCADLVMQNVTVLKRSKNSITLEYELLNRGGAVAALIVGQKKKQESLAIRASLSSSQKLTRGALVLESLFLHGEEINLRSGEIYRGKVKLPLYKLTKFTPILILELDAFEFVEECDESNNLHILRLLEDQIH